MRGVAPGDEYLPPPTSAQPEHEGRPDADAFAEPRPGAVSWGENRIDVFVRGHAYGLAQMTWTDAGGWTSWKNNDG